MDKLEAAQPANDGGEIVLLEETDCGDAGGSRCEAGCGVFESDTSEREDGDFVCAGLAERFEALRLRARSIYLFEDGSEEG